MNFSVAVVLFDMKMHSNSTAKKLYRSLSIGDLSQRSLVSCLSTLSKDFSSEATVPISFKFHMQPPGSGGKKVYIFGHGHMTKIATMPICDKNLKKSFSPEPLGQLP